LAEGDFARGWAGYGSRFELWDDPRYRHKGFHKRASPPPYWQGQDPAGKRFLVWTEQGIGDEILFSGLLPEFASRASSVILECSERMVPVFERSFSNLRVNARGRSRSQSLGPVDADYQVAIGDLGRWLRPDFNCFPNRPKFLAADPWKTAELKRQYGSGPLIGISWRSGADRVGERKSFPLESWHDILRIPGARFISLQYGDFQDEAAMGCRKLGVDVLWDNRVDALANMDDYFAQVAAMDLIISVSNTAVHVAGALGQPTWVMLPTGPGCHWYWFRGVASSPWYPTLRLYRQRHRLNQSPDVDKKHQIQAIASDLKGWVRSWLKAE
jgi:hypothetical protein